MSAYTSQPQNLPGLKALIKKTISKESDRCGIIRRMRKALQQLPFFKTGVKLQICDPSLKLRYRYAVNFWKEKTDDETITIEQAKELIEELEVQINDKNCVHPEGVANNEDKEFSDFFGKTKSKDAGKQSLGEKTYVTCKCDNKLYVKPSNTYEAEVEIYKDEIDTDSILHIYGLISPGDEIQVIRSVTGGRPSIYVTKCTGLGSVETHDEKASFIRGLLDRVSNDPLGLTVLDILCERCRGVWDHIKNDDELFVDDQCVRDVWKLVLLLTEKLQSGLNDCFLQDFSASLFFIKTMPQFIEDNPSGLNSDDIRDLKSLLGLMMQFAPQTATRIWEVAECLAKVIEDRSKYQGVKYLVHLGKILAKFIQGYQEVDTANIEWNELPTIPTKKEIFTEFDLHSLEAIKRDKPYESVGQYLDINYKLLREECFRNLFAGIQNFCEDNSYDSRKMKMYRITLDTVFYDSQTFLVLKCEDYNTERKESNENNEDTTDKILYGSLMCISLNKTFDTLTWATVVKCELEKTSDRKIVSVRLCSDRNKESNIDVLLKLCAATNEGDYALMAESPTFFQAFGPSMDRLKEMHKKDDMPFVEELVKAKKSKPPEYACDKDQICDWSIIFKKQTGCEFTFPKDRQLSPIEQFKHLKESIHVSQSLLDETQMLAIENFLENRVSIIQGPPGTGKSYLGAKILHLMMSMQIHKRYEGPILVMTYKNVALDHFLESCLQFTSNIVRIGTSKNENLSEINLNNVRRSKGIKKEFLNMDKKATENMRCLRYKLKTLFKCLSNPVFTLQAFFKTASENHIRSLLTMSPDGNQNIPAGNLDDLLSKWKQNNVPKELKELVKTSLNEWLPKDKIKEKFGEKKPVSVQFGKNRVSVSKKNDVDEEDCVEDAIDKKVVAQEREQDAVEDDCIENQFEDSYVPNKTESENEPLSDVVYIPFVCKNQKEAEKNIVDEELNLWLLSPDERVNYICALQSKVIREFTKAAISYENNAKRHQVLLDGGTVELLKEYDVIGMTVTGAATRLHLLNQLKPCAVIVEEAAEIIEGQLVSVLPPTIQHLVMLGDQKQLRPSISCYKLKREKHLDCSMFERLINNKMPFQQLGKQCRMRDDIADLLRLLNIYPKLETNSEKTCNNEPPDCIGHSLYFVKHTSPESQIEGSSSVWNVREVKDILSVAEYLMKNGYPASHVTVLCPYRGQVDKMKAAFEKRSSSPSEKYLTELKDIKITTVDSFQGEENKVILLSLVRSNKNSKIGFFSEENRICVAISRAQCALYMFGNNSVYSSSSQKWKKIIEELERREKIGTKFPFKEDPDGVSSVKDDEPINDKTKLFPNEIERLSQKIVRDWQRIARLANLNPDKVVDVNLDHVHHQGPINKAAQILKMISEHPKFSRKELAGHFEEVKYDFLVDPLLTGMFRSPGADIVDK